MSIALPKPWPVALACLLACAGAGAETASEAPSRLSGWTFGYSPYTLHYSDAKKENDWEPDDQKHSYVWLLQAEKALDERHIAGLAIFSNSFGQFTQYAYYGWQFRPFDSMPKFYAKITGGIIHGYKEPYEKKIPLNHKSGWGITAIPAIGYQVTPNWGAAQRAGQRGPDVPGELHGALSAR